VNPDDPSQDQYQLESSEENDIILDEYWEEEDDVAKERREKFKSYDLSDSELKAREAATQPTSISLDDLSQRELDDLLLNQMNNLKPRTEKHLPITNAKILYPTITVIDHRGQRRDNVYTKDILNEYDSMLKSNFILVLVSPTLKIARLLPKNIYSKHLQKANSQRQQTVKEINSNHTIQISWNMGQADLDHRLTKASKFLKNEGRLDIIMGARNTKLTRDRSERIEMVEKIRKTLEPFGFEWKSMSGGFPYAELWFKGHPPSIQKKNEISPVDENLLGDDDTGLSRAELRKQKYQRYEVYRDAAEEYRNKFISASPDEVLDQYWANLATSTSTKITTDPTPVKEKKEHKTRRVKNREHEEVKHLREDAKEIAETKLKDIASKFEGLGRKKSIFGLRAGMGFKLAAPPSNRKE
jgi:translation initiation factor IF-3